jgi:NADH:ubiquinone oxidoreductase subunit F (NADH-binding)/(2Fe-2S) ferredoxin/Pyruvate/2-oxoacid:ferredoxin oxidoreductase delta subunit
MKQYRLHLLICAGTGCVANRSLDIKEELEREIEKQELRDEVAVYTTGCQGFCERGPIVIVQPGNIFYQRVKKEDIPHLVEEHLLKGRPVKSLMYIPSPEEPPIPKMMDIGFFKHQRLIVLKNRGRLDPENIEEYIGFDGYRALEKALSKMTPEEITREIKASGLRGRGGAGFPTGLKWELCRRSPGEIKYIICNGDEGDPGAFMDRSVLEADPHAVIEGMIIGARAIGAHKGFIYVRKEYPLAVKRLKVALNQAKEYGILGKNILGTGFDFSIDVVQGAGAFVCGEETALLASIEGKVGRPRPRPPYPVEKGLWGKPTNINNVETWANVPSIILRSAKWFSSIGTKTSKGTKIFSLVGKINNTGLVEVPMGITLREIIFDIGGGIKDDEGFKGVQLGGPSGGIIPEEYLDTPVDYESLIEAGAIMGSGGMVVLSENDCMVDTARYFLNFTQEESCGKCTFCRVGTKRMLEILDKIIAGEAREEDLETLIDLSEKIKQNSLCGLGKTAPNPVLTTLRYFMDEYKAHILESRCPAKVCINLIKYEITDKCIGCTKCARECPTEAIIGEVKKLHKIVQDKCVKCGICKEVCPVNAVEVVDNV